MRTIIKEQWQVFGVELEEEDDSGTNPTSRVLRVKYKLCIGRDVSENFSLKHIYIYFNLLYET